MKKSLFVILLITILGTAVSCSSTDVEKIPIFPYEIDGKKGFMNTNFEIIREPEYYAGEYDFADYSKYASISSKLIDEQSEDRIFYLIRSDGTEKKLPIDYDAYTLIGDDYYVINFETKKNERDYYYATVTSVWNPEEVYTFKNGKIRYGLSPEWIVISGYIWGDEKIINLKGETKWSHPESYCVGGIYPEANLIFINPTTYSTNMIDLEGSFLNDYEWCDQCGYNESLFLSGKYYNGGSVLEMGFFNREGEKIIPIELIPGRGRFNCGVVPLLSENGKYYAYSGEGKDSDNWLLIDTNGNPVVSNISAFDISTFCDEGSAILTTKSSEGKKQKLINNRGEELNPYKYEWIKEPVNGFYRARRDNLDYIIDAKTGEEYKCKDFK